MGVPKIEIKHGNEDGPDYCNCMFVRWCGLGRVDCECRLNGKRLNDYTEGAPRPSNNKDCPGPGKYYLIKADDLVERVAKGMALNRLKNDPHMRTNASEGILKTEIESCLADARAALQAIGIEVEEEGRG